MSSSSQSVCWAFAKGASCSRGSRCRFRHVLPHEDANATDDNSKTSNTRWFDTTSERKERRSSSANPSSGTNASTSSSSSASASSNASSSSNSAHIQSGRKADVQSDRIPTTNAEGSGSKCAQKSTNREAVGESTWSNAQERVNTQPSVIPCRFYQQGYCRFGSECWFLHEVPDKLGNKAAITDKDDAPTCSICYEVPTTFGLLVSCDHIFCIDCVRSWRKSRRQSSICSDQTKTCPLCRKKVPYVVPSSRVPRDAQDKVSIIDSYKSAVAKIPCKYFAETKSCPFGDLCLYQHANADGTRYIMGPPKRERRRNNPFEGFEGFEGGPMILDEDFPDFGGLSFFESDVESSAWNVLIDAFESYEYDWEVEDDIEDYRDSDEEAFVYPGEEPEDILTFLPSHMDSNEYDWAPW